jgi:hypothetical protein
MIYEQEPLTLEVSSMNWVQGHDLWLETVAAIRKLIEQAEMDPQEQERLEALRQDLKQIGRQIWSSSDSEGSCMQ